MAKDEGETSAKETNTKDEVKPEETTVKTEEGDGVKKEPMDEDPPAAGKEVKKEPKEEENDGEETKGVKKEEVEDGELSVDDKVKKEEDKSDSKDKSKKDSKSKKDRRRKERSKERSHKKRRKSRRKDRSRSRSRSRKKKRRSRSRSRKKRRRSRKRSRSRSRNKKRKRRKSRRSRSRSRSRSKTKKEDSSVKKEEGGSTTAATEVATPVTLATSGNAATSTVAKGPSPAAIQAQKMRDARAQTLINMARLQEAKKGVGMLPEITRPARRLYVGNLPTGMGMNEIVLTQFFTECCKGLGITDKSPVISSWLNTDQTFGFVELRSVAATTLALQLFQGLQLGGRQLKFGRPVDYKLPPANLLKYIIPIPGEEKTDTAVGVKEGTPAAMLAKLQRSHVNMDSVGVGVLSNEAPLGSLRRHTSAKELVTKKNPEDKNKSIVLCVENLMKKEYFLDDDEYEDVVDDLRVECYNLSLGLLEEVLVPKPGGDYGDKGVMRVFLMFASLNAATRVLNKIHGRQYDGQEVDVWYFPLKHWENRRLDAHKDGTLPYVAPPPKPTPVPTVITAEGEQATPAAPVKRDTTKTITQDELEAELLGESMPPGL